MNIFDLSVEEIKTEFQKILDSYSVEELKEALERAELGIKEKEKIQ